MEKSRKRVRFLILQMAKVSHRLFTLIFFAHFFAYKLGKLHDYCFFHDLNRSKHIMMPYFPDSYIEEINLYANTFWRIFGKHNLKNIVIICGNRAKAQEVQEKFIHELRNNELLKFFNHGFKEKCVKARSIELPNYHAKISILTYPEEPCSIKHYGLVPEMVIMVDIDSNKYDIRDIFWWVKFSVYKYDTIRYTYLLGTLRESHPVSIFDKIMYQKMKRYQLEKNSVLEKCSMYPFPLFDIHNQCLWEERYSKEECEKLLNPDHSNKDSRSKRSYLLYSTHHYSEPVTEMERIYERIRLLTELIEPFEVVYSDDIKVYTVGEKVIGKTTN